MSRRERREREEQEAKEKKLREKEEKKQRKIDKKRAKKQGKVKTKKASKKRNNKKQKNKKEKGIISKFFGFILKVFLVLLIILCLIAGVIVGYLGVQTNWNKNDMIKLFAKQTTMIITGQSEEDLKNLKPIYCLVMGISTDIDVKLTDTIMVCACYPKTQQASLLSIPRDTFVGTSQSTAGGSDKINAVYAVNKNDPKATLRKVEQLTGLKIKNYVVVDTKALVKVVDKIGGVYFDVPINMKYDSKKQNLHINLKKGKQLIDGKKAEQLLRFRKNNNHTSYPAEYGSDDYGRMRTQRDFIIATVKQTLKLKNVTKMKDLAKIVFDNVDTNMKMNEVIKYLPAAIEFDVNNIESANLPGVSARIGPQNLWFFVHDEEETEKIINEMFLFNEKKEKDVSLKKDELSIQVLDGSGNEKKAKKFVKELKNIGYTNISEGKTNITTKTKLINRTGKSKSIYSDVKELISNTEQIYGKSNGYEIDYTIIVGNDIS